MAYEMLGVDPNADDTAIKAAFRRAAKECHPDLNNAERTGERLRLLLAARAALISLRRQDGDQSKSNHPDTQPPARNERSNILASTVVSAFGLLLLHLMSQHLGPTRAIRPSQPLPINRLALGSLERVHDGALAGTPDKPAQPSEIPPSFDIAYTDQTGKLVAAGRGKAGWIIRLKSGTQTLGEAMADERDEWVLTPEGPLAPGNHTLSLLEIDPISQRGISGPKTVTLSIGPDPKTDGSKAAK